MKINQENTPPNTRFLYKGFLIDPIREDFLLEWSPSGKYAHLKKRGWLTFEEISKFELLEKLPDSSYNEEEYLCPNCITPWKCNGPHLEGAKNEPRLRK